MFTIAYVSKASWKMSRQELLLLLLDSRNNNYKHKITGLLVYAGGYFVQVIEGDKHDIEKLFTNIRNDRRHNEVRTLIRQEVDERTFRDWSMGFVEAIDQEMDNILGLSGFFKVDYEYDALVRENEKIYQLLLDFKNDNALRTYVEV